MIYGYARVSQSVDAQVKHLRQAGAGKVFRETASGARAGRPQLRRALAKPDAGDVLFVTRLDRLARSTRELLNTLAATAERGARKTVRDFQPPEAKSDDMESAPVIRSSPRKAGTQATNQDSG